MNRVQPMLAKGAEMSRMVPLCEDDLYGAQQKIDGDRLLMHVDDGVAQPWSRNGLPLAGVKSFVTNEFRNMNGHWVFDGEYLDHVFYVFDLIEGGKRSFVDEPLIERHRVLTRFFEQWNPARCVRLLPLYTTHEDKCELAKYVMVNQCEGLVFKVLSSQYRGSLTTTTTKKSDQWLKLKRRYDCDCVVIGKRRGGKANLVLAVYRDGVEVDVGEVSAVTGDGPRVNIGDVVSVVYQYASEADKLVSATMPKLRHDKAAHECTADQLVRQNRAVRL